MVVVWTKFAKRSSIVTNAINFFEIPSIDFDRAVAFYTAILGVELYREVFMGIPSAMFPVSEDGAGGAIIHSEAKPSADGPIIYLNANGKLAEMVARVEPAGGTVLRPLTSIGDPGYIAIIRDTEGNRIGLHSEREAHDNAG
jgi:predicted enzyme related to lactoylglutathione lyase